MARTAKVRFVGGMWDNHHFELELWPTVQWKKTGETYKLYRYQTRFGTHYWQYIHTSLIDKNGRPYDCTQCEVFAKGWFTLRHLEELRREWQSRKRLEIVGS